MLVKHYRIILFFFLSLMPFASCIFLRVSVSSHPCLCNFIRLSFFILPSRLHISPQDMVQTFCCSHIIVLSFILKQFAFVVFNSIIKKQTTLKFLFSISVYLSLFYLYWPLSYWVHHLYSNIFFPAFLMLPSTRSFHDHSSQGVSQWGIIIG